MPSVLITGGAGFIGSHVADLFLANGASVTVVDNLSSGRRENVPAAARFLEHDIRDQAVLDLITAGTFDLICHLAAQMDVRRSVEAPLFDADVNVRGSLLLMEAARHAPQPPRIIFSSTGGAIYGDDVIRPTPESASAVPAAPYGIAKLSVEHYLGAYAALHGVPSLALRYGNVYGPRQSPHGEAGVVAIFAGRLLKGESITMFGDGEQTRDYVYVGDVARANLLAASAALPSGIAPAARALNIGTGEPRSVRTLADAIAHAVGEVTARPVTPRVTFAPARAGELAHSCLDISRATAALDWRPVTSFADGIRATVQWSATSLDA